MFESCEYVYKYLTHFIYDYLVVAMEMHKWCPPKGQELGPIIEEQPLALSYAPWTTLGDSTNKDIN